MSGLFIYAINIYFVSSFTTHKGKNIYSRFIFGEDAQGDIKNFFAKFTLKFGINFYSPFNFLITNYSEK